MYTVDLYRRVRRAHFVEGMSVRELARMFDLHRNTVNKIQLGAARLPAPSSPTPAEARPLHPRHRPDHPVGSR